MAPGVIGMTVLFTAMFSGIAMLWDRQFGSEERWSAMPRLLHHDRPHARRRHGGSVARHIDFRG